jgi:hypothetical protein
VRVEFVERRRHHLDVLDRRARAGGATQDLDLLLGRRVDLDDLAVDRAAGSRGAEPLGDRREARAAGLETDPGRQAGDAPQRLDRAVRDLGAAVHDDDPVGPLLELGQRVRRQEHHGAAVAQLADDAVEAAAQRRIEPARRLVEKQHRGGADERLGEAETLPHALRVGADPPRRGRAEPDTLEEAERLADRHALQPRIEGERLAAGQGRVERHVLRQVAEPAPSRELAGRGVLAEHADRPGARLDEAQHELEEGRLAGPVMADERDHRAGRQRERDVAHRLDAAVSLADAVELDGHRPSPPAQVRRAGGAISGWPSTTPPGKSAGNCDCAQRITCTAGLLASTLACGAVHITRSITSFGR